MKRMFGSAVIVLAALAGIAWWPEGGRLVVADSPETPLPVVPASADPQPPQPLTAQPRTEPRPTGPEDDGAQPDTVLDADAVAAFRQSLAEGDRRVPPIVRGPEEPRPEPEILDQPDAYAAWEAQQDLALKQRFLQAAVRKVAFLEQEIERARAQGLDPESLREGEEKVRRLKAMMAELRAQHPELVAPSE